MSTKGESRPPKRGRVSGKGSPVPEPGGWREKDRDASWQGQEAPRFAPFSENLDETGLVEVNLRQCSCRGGLPLAPA
ncbi:hypothetical protein GCM10018954_043460 [Kutzneria kofuensis]